MLRNLVIGFSLVGLLAIPLGCGGEETAEPADEFGVEAGDVDENGKPSLGDTGWQESAGKADALTGRRGLAVSADNTNLQVWKVSNAWDDTDTPAARKAGMAWGEDSGLNWDEKYSRWVESLEKVDAHSWGKTMSLTTPWGKTLDSPALECAEVAMFLRITFASWYELPFFLEARDRQGNRLYFGHMGIRTAAGRYGSMPRFRSSYQDHSSKADAFRAGEIEWPSDAKLRSRKIVGSFDDAQPMIGPDAHAGAYFDEIFLNKRVGYFMLITLTYFGSVNLVDSAQTFNVKAEATRPGDVLLERWQANGIGHTLVVLQRTDLGTIELDGETVPTFEIELASGSMPRRQPRWDNSAGSKRYLTNNMMGGPGYEDFRGGMKRWRTAANVGGQWTNIVPATSADDWMDSRKKDELAARIARFDAILTELSPDEKLKALEEVVDGKRMHLRQFPASCSARIGREDAFKELYEVGEELGRTQLEMDREYRRLEDYVFVELEYNKSKTCCWNSSTGVMYDLVMEYNRMMAEDPVTGECREVVAFKNRADGGDGFEIFREFAEAKGMGEEWVKWSADESCPQADIAEATEAAHAWTELCSVYESLPTE